MGEDPFGAGSGVVADEGDAVDVAVLDSSTMERVLCRPVIISARASSFSRSRLRMVQCASLMRTWSAPPS